MGCAGSFLEKLDQASRLRNLYPVLLFLRQDRLIRASPPSGSMARSMRQNVSEYTPPPFYAPPGSTTLWLWAWHAFASYCTPYFTSLCKHRQRTYVHTALPILESPRHLVWIRDRPLAGATGNCGTGWSGRKQNLCASSTSTATRRKRPTT